MLTTKNIWVNGCFDILHRGHLELFKYAKSFGGTVVVGMDSDSRVKSLKGDTRPINNQDDRKFMLESLRYIDKVVIFDCESRLRDLVCLFQPCIMIVGSDYRNKPVIGSEYAKELKFFERIGDYSTTNILESQ